MEKFALLAKPWWVNLLILAPFLAYWLWKNKLNISKKILFYAAIFGTAFGFVEATVVIYLRDISGLLSNYTSSALQPKIVAQLPANLLFIETAREAATIIMLVSIALIAVKERRERWAIFFWAFAFWDIFYYVGLKLTINWPGSFATPDVLFLIPVPWYSQVWFPLLISALLMLAVITGRK